MATGSGESRSEAKKPTASATTEEHLNYFMKLACLSAARCKGQTQIGAVIVRNSRKIVSVGSYRYIEPTDDDKKDFYACHAESDALLNAAGADVAGCTVYVTSFPCSVCLSQLIEVGITDIIYLVGPPRDGGPGGVVLPEYRAADKLMMALIWEENSGTRKLYCRSYREELVAITKSRLVSEFPQPFEVKVEKHPGAADKYNVKYLHDDQYFMGLAYLAAKLSPDPLTKGGACIVDSDGRVIGLGFRAHPAGCESFLTWKGDGTKKTSPDWTDTKYPYVIHAVTMAILNRNSASNLKGSKLYVTHYPDCDCARWILQSGITEVHYWSNEKKEDDELVIGKRMLEGDERANVLQQPATPGPVTVRQFVRCQYATFKLPDETTEVSVLRDEPNDLIVHRPESATNGGSHPVTASDD